MTSKRFKVSIIYFVVVILTLLFRVASALDIYSALGIQNDDAFWTCIVQIVIFGAVPFVLYMVFVASKQDKLLPYFPTKKRKKSSDDGEGAESTKQDEGTLYAVDSEYVHEDANVQPAQSFENSADASETNSDSLEPQFDKTTIETADTENAEQLLEKSEALNIEDGNKVEAAEDQATSSANTKAKEAFSVFLRDFGFRKLSFKNALLTIVLAVCMITIGTAVSMLWQLILSLMGFTASSSHTHYEGIGDLFLQILLVAVLPGFFEEFSHRGLISAGYRDSGWKFVVLSALYFSLMHQNIRQTGYTFVDGLAIALAMYYTGSIWPGIMMHFINNFWSVFLGYVSDVGGAFSFIITVDNWLFSTIGGLIVCVLLVLLAVILATIVFIYMRKDAVKSGRISDRLFAKSNAYPLHRDLVFWLTVVVGVVATVFSLVWGLIR